MFNARWASRIKRDLDTELTQHDISEYLVIGANSDAQAKDLRELEYNGGAHFRKVGDGSGEFSNYKTTGQWIPALKEKCTIPLEGPGPKRWGICWSEPQKRSIIFLCGLLHKLLVFVQPVCGMMKMDRWNSLDIHILWDRQQVCNLLCMVYISGVGKDADGHVGAWPVRSLGGILTPSLKVCRRGWRLRLGE